jgi:hypothetical protein
LGDGRGLAVELVHEPARGRNRVEIAGLDLVLQRNPAPLLDAFVTKSAA